MTPFTERQYFRQLWIWAILFVFNFFILYMVWSSLYGDRQESPYDSTGLMIGVAGMILVNLIFIFSRLDTKLDETGVHYRFFPFMRKWKTKRWDEIDQIFIRRYNPIFEYGGWGIRIGIFGNGWAYNVSGNMGIQMKLKSGKRILLGTNRPEEAVAYLKSNDLY